MKSLLLFMLVSLLFAEPTATEYVCLPCGLECDHEVYAKPGNCAHCGMELVDKSTVKFTQATVEDFCRRIAANPKAIILDVRSSAEFAGTTADVPSFGHFKNAINISVTELERKLDQLAAYRNQEILVYCSHSHRSQRASYLLGTKGFTKVVNMQGGVSTLEVNLSACLKDKFVRH